MMYSKQVSKVTTDTSGLPIPRLPKVENTKGVALHFGHNLHILISSQVNVYGTSNLSEFDDSQVH